MLASGNELWGMPFPGSYMKLYNATAHAVKAVDSQIKVGGTIIAEFQAAFSKDSSSNRANRWAARPRRSCRT